MKIIRNGVFETNSSTTHSLVLFNQIRACGIELDNSKEVTITLVPLCDTAQSDNEWQKEIVNSLNHVSYMVDYIYTRLMFAKYQIESGWYGDNPNEDVKEMSNKSSVLIDKMQKYLVELGYTITYKQPLVFNEDISSYDKIYIEHNDGSTLEYIEDFEEVLESKETFARYLKDYTWVIAYNG